jgi:transposase
MDVHKKAIVVCCMTPNDAGGKQVESRTIGTITQDILALSDWLTSKQLTRVTMESTGEFWKPVYNILEGSVHSWSESGLMSSTACTPVERIKAISSRRL